MIILYLVGSTESQLHIGRLETEVRERSAQVEALSSHLQEIKVEKAQLVEQLSSINSLLEASLASKEEDKNQVGHHFSLSCVRCSHMPEFANLTPFVMASNREMLQNWTNCSKGKCFSTVMAQFKTFHLVNCNSVIPAAFRRRTIS